MPQNTKNNAREQTPGIHNLVSSDVISQAKEPNPKGSRDSIRRTSGKGKTVGTESSGSGGGVDDQGHREVLGVIK